MKKTLLLIGLVFLSKFLMAFGGEGTNLTYNMPYDTQTETLRINNPGARTLNTAIVIARDPSTGYIGTLDTYPNLFTAQFATKSSTDLAEGTKLFFTDARARAALSAGDGVIYNSSTGVISFAKNEETSSGTTNASGTYTFTFAKTYSVAPNVQANIINGTDSQIIRIGTPTTTAVTVTVRNRTDVIGLLPTWSNVNGATVDISIKEK